MSFLRVVAQLPFSTSLSKALADGEPFRTIDDKYRLCERGSLAPSSAEPLMRACRAAFTRQETAGFTRLAKVQAIFFDMDATVIVEESLVELARHAGKSEPVARITERAMAGELDFAAALRERVRYLAGVPATALDAVAAGLTLMPGITELAAFCRALGVPMFLISGGFVQLAEGVARQLGFSGFSANTLGVADGLLTGEVVGDIVDAEAKRRFLLSTCDRLGLSPAAVAAVGDGANDALMLAAAGLAVGHQPRPVLWPLVHAANFSGDHRFLAPLLFGRGLSARRD